MRLIVLSEYFHPDNSGGTPTDLSELVRFLKDKSADLEIDVLTSRNLYRGDLQNPLPRFEDWSGVHITRLRTLRSNGRGTMFRLLAGGAFSVAALCHLLGRRPYDLVFIVTNPPSNGFVAWAYRKIRGVPYVYLVHDLYPDIAVALGVVQDRAMLTRGFRCLQRSWLRSAARIVVLGRCMKSHVEAAYGIPSSAVETIASWSAPAPDGGMENKVGLWPDLSGQFVILYAGNFSRYVNFEQILGAAKLVESDPRIQFILIGDGSEKVGLTARIEREKLNNVKVLPKVPRAEMGRILAGSSVALVSLNSRMLGLGVPSKLYSIMAGARPIVAIVPEESEVARVLAEEQCGIRVADGDAASLAQEIGRLSRDEPLVRAMGQRAQEAFERRFTLAKAGGQFDALFRRIVNQP